MLLSTLFGSEGQGQRQQQQGASSEARAHETSEGSQQHALTQASSEAEAAAGGQPASEPHRYDEAELADAADATAGGVASSRGGQAGQGWPTTKPATHTGFATGTPKTAPHPNPKKNLKIGPFIDVFGCCRT